LRGKTVVHFDDGDDNIAYVASGKDGVKAYDTNSGALVYQSGSEMITTGNSNGLDSENGYLYIANGADGLAICPMPTTANPTIAPIFNWDMASHPASANYVVANGQWVLVAKGRGGFNVIRKVSTAN